MTGVEPVDLFAVVENARSIRPHTKRAYRNAVRQWLAVMSADPAAWTAPKAQAFYDDLTKRISPAAANSLLGGLSWSLARAHAMYPQAGIVDVTKAIDRYKITRDLEAPTRRRSLNAPQARALLAACAGADLLDLRDHAAVTLGLYTGMRRMSMVGCDLAHVTDHGAYVTIRVPIKGGDLYPVPVDRRAWARLEPYLTALEKVRPAKGGKGARPLFPALTAAQPTLADPIGRRTVRGPLTEDGLYKSIQARADAAGLASFSPHLFRHTFSTWCRAAGVQDYLIEVVTAHKSNRGMVDRVYTDRAALYADVAARCYEAVTARLGDAA